MIGSRHNPKALFNFSFQEVTDLQNKNYTNSSVTLIWSPPKDPYSHFYTYWVQCTSEEETQRKQDPAGHETKSKDSTKESWYEVKTLRSGTLCNFSLWAERNNILNPIKSSQVPTGDMPHSLCR